MIEVTSSFGSDCRAGPTRFYRLGSPLSLVAAHYWKHSLSCHPDCTIDVSYVYTGEGQVFVPLGDTLIRESQEL